MACALSSHKLTFHISDKLSIVSSRAYSSSSSTPRMPYIWSSPWSHSSIHIANFTRRTPLSRQPIAGIVLLLAFPQLIRWSLLQIDHFRTATMSVVMPIWFALHPNAYGLRLAKQNRKGPIYTAHFVQTQIRIRGRYQLSESGWISLDSREATHFCVTMSAGCTNCTTGNAALGDNVSTRAHVCLIIWSS